MRIGLLETGRTSAELTARHGSFPAMFRVLFGPLAPALEFRDYAALDGELPATTRECDAYLITGSQYGINERLAWMAPLQDFARAVRADDRRLVGICFGHQLLADAFGGSVAKADEGWGVGMQRYDVRASRPWMAPPARSFANIVLHQDQVTIPPPEAELLAGNDFCPFAMLQIGANVLTLQSHPELTAALTAEVLDLRRREIGEARAQAALASLRHENDAELVAGWLLRFLTAGAEVEMA